MAAEWAVPMELLGVALLAIVVVGWATGFVLFHAFGGQTLAHLDLPAKAFFSRHRQPDLLRAMQDVTIAGSDRMVLPIALAAGMWWRWRRSSWQPLVVTVAAYAGGALIAVSDKVAVGRGRPSGSGLATLSGLAFPSGHATQAMAVYGTIGALAILGSRRRSARLVIGAATALVIGGVAFSRLYLGVHWLTDVVAGLALGAMWVTALVCVARRRRAAWLRPAAA